MEPHQPWGAPGLGEVSLYQVRIPRAVYVLPIISGLPWVQSETLGSEHRIGSWQVSWSNLHLQVLSTLSTQKHANFSCSSFVPDGPPERAPSLPPHSPSIASPGPEQIPGHCTAGPGPGSFCPSPSDKYPGFGFEEGPAGSPGRFLKSNHMPFHPYKRHFHEDIFPEAQTAMALDGHSYKTPGALEAFEEIPVDVGDAEAFLPGFPAEAWCNGLPYPSQEHSQVLVSTSGQVHLASFLLAT